MTHGPRFFVTAAEWRAWLEANHDREREVWVGYHRKASGRPSITWSESVDEALCFGWIDGVRKRIDETSYMNRFTPRRPQSNWSAINVAKVEALIAAGRMHAAGLAAYEQRDPARTVVYSFENDPRLSPEYEARLREAGVWEFLESTPPSHRKLLAHWVMTAKRPETRERRLAQAIAKFARGERL
jgi:uncharacterized protein YdeI (YjbR/CyaY-like superfamily)